MTLIEQNGYEMQILPYYVVLGISVSKIFVCIAWYRVVLRQNTIDLTMDIFKLRVIWDIVTLGGILLFSIMGMEAVWEAMVQCFFQAFVQLLIYLFCVKRAERKLKELKDLSTKHVGGPGMVF